MQKSAPLSAVEVINTDAKVGTLIFFHGRWEGGSQARRLANALGPNQRFISISPHGIQGQLIPASFKDMAFDRLELIRAAQPSGPYRLGGYCNGALVAYETARLLIAAGERVEYVILVEPPTANARRLMRCLHRMLSGAGRILAGETERSKAWMSRIMKVLWVCAELALTRRGWKHQLEVTGETTKKVFAMLLGRRIPSRTPSEGYFQLDEGNTLLLRQHYQIAAAYLPEPLDVATVLFTSGKNDHGEQSFMFNGAAWRSINPDVEIVSLPGTHETSMALGCRIIAAHLRTISQRCPVALAERGLAIDGAGGGPCAA